MLLLLRSRLARLSGLTSFPRFACLTRLTGFAGLMLTRFERGAFGLERRVLRFGV